MRIEETTVPVERRFNVELTLDELKVLAGATGVANFEEVKRNLEARRITVEKSNDVLYKLHCGLADYLADNVTGRW